MRIGTNRDPTTSLKWLEAALSGRFALPETHHKGSFSYFSDSFSTLDVSHLSQTGWVAHRPSAQRKAISSWLHTPLSYGGHKASSSAPKGATPRFLARFAGSVSSVLSALRPLLVLVRMRGGDFSL